MKKPWSLSTTVRNPERLRDFLMVLKALEGQPFNNENQIKYQILLIQNKKYKPTILTHDQLQYFIDIEKEMPFSVATEIFNAQDYEAPAMRGRNSVAPLNKMGLCIAKNMVGSVKITALGQYFLSEDYDLGKLFFLHFLKWQLPNPASSVFSEKDGFSIKPFVGTLHLINEVNKKWSALGNEPIGISKDEFSLFAPTLINYRDVQKQANKLIAYRSGLRQQKDDTNRKLFKEQFKNEFASSFLGTKDTAEINGLIGNLKDYGDNAIRYFRLTRYIYIRGGGFYIDLEPRRSIEINKLLSSDNAAPLKFRNADEYIEYLADIEKPVLPWETKSELVKIAEILDGDVRKQITEMRTKSIKIPEFEFKIFEGFGTQELKLYIEELRAYRRKLQDLETHLKSQDAGNLQKYINLLKNIHKSSNKKSIELERLATLALNALNDALNIKPNYPVGDDNEPTFTAPANKPDIECFYSKFNSVCEVTMLTDRSQWYNEGQPVMRHLRDFELTHGSKETYCLFIAPRVHQDTVETFWMAIKFGYKGTKQKIIPISIKQLVSILEILLELKNQGKQFTHSQLLALYLSILALSDRVSHSEEWLEQIPEAISAWHKSILATK